MERIFWLVEQVLFALSAIKNYLFALERFIPSIFSTRKARKQTRSSAKAEN